jgi:signal transduction histidine kinase
VKLDADVLKETIFSLVRNARDAMPRGGKLTISLREEGLDPHRAYQLGLLPTTFVLLSVADTGSGMDDETQRHVFEPFFTTKRMATVEGLGLASIYGFIQQSGGTITVRSTPKQGSTFELYLPTAQTVQHQVAA